MQLTERFLPIVSLLGEHEKKVKKQTGNKIINNNNIYI